MEGIVTLWLRVRLALDGHRRRLAERGLDPESGQALIEWLGLAALSIVAIVAVGAALNTLGLDVVAWIREQLVQG